MITPRHFPSIASEILIVVLNSTVRKKVKCFCIHSSQTTQRESLKAQLFHFRDANFFRFPNSVSLRRENEIHFSIS